MVRPYVRRNKILVIAKSTLEEKNKQKNRNINTSTTESENSIILPCFSVYNLFLLSYTRVFADNYAPM